VKEDVKVEIGFENNQSLELYSNQNANRIYQQQQKYLEVEWLCKVSNRINVQNPTALNKN